MIGVKSPEGAACAAVAAGAETWKKLRRNDHLADRPECYSGELDMSPGEGNADDRHRKGARGGDMPEREPPPCQYQPDQVADHAQRSGADVGSAGEAVAAHRLLTERQQGIDGD